MSNNAISKVVITLRSVSKTRRFTPPPPTTTSVVGNHVRSICCQTTGLRRRGGIINTLTSNNNNNNPAMMKPWSNCTRFLSSAASSSSSSMSSSTATSSTAISDILQETGIDRLYLDQLAVAVPTPLRLQDMYKYGSSSNFQQRLRNAQFLHQELPIRIAQRAVDLLTLPHGLSNAPSIQQVAAVYLQFLAQFQTVPSPTTAEEERAFTKLLAGFVLDRESIPKTIAQGVQEWRSLALTSFQNADEFEQRIRLQEMEEALYRFFTARCGLRFLTEHYVMSCPKGGSNDLMPNVTSLFPDEERNNKTTTTAGGCIQPNVNIVSEIQKVVDLVKTQTSEYYNGKCPDIELVDCAAHPAADDKFAFTYVPHHLHYMLYELLKNSCRASIRRHAELVQEAAAEAEAEQQQDDANVAATGTLNHHHQQQQQKLKSPAQAASIEIPPIRIIVVKGEEDVTIKVADRGGGIPRSHICNIWKFAHSTASSDELETSFGQDGMTGANLRGFGLPLARIYARYFGGELTLKSTEGYGLDAYLHLPRLGNCCENLPLRVRDSPGEQISMPVGTTSSSSSSGSGSMNHNNIVTNFSKSKPRQGNTTTTNTTTNISNDNTTRQYTTSGTRGGAATRPTPPTQGFWRRPFSHTTTPTTTTTTTTTTFPQAMSTKKRSSSSSSFIKTPIAF